MAQAGTTSRGSSSELAVAAAKIRFVAVAVFAGFLSGAVALGVGCRLAMRIVALLASDADQGTLTDADAVVGDISVGGTVFLVLLGGAVGTLGGLLYAAMRKRLVWCGRFRGVAFGCIALLIFASQLIEGGNPDFERLGVPLVNVAMFGSLFVFFGALIAPVYDALDSAVPRAHGIIGRALVPVQFAGLLLLVPVIAIVTAVFIADDRGAAIATLLVIGAFAYILSVPASPMAARRFRPAARGAGPRAALTSLAPLAPAMAIGAALDLHELIAIF